MEISVDMAAQILSYLPYTEIAAFKRVNGTFGCAVERYRKFLPKTTIHLAITSRGGETEKHARIIIFHKRKTFAFGMDPCCTNFETAFPLDGFVYSAKYNGPRRRISGIPEFFKSLLSKATISMLNIDHLSPEWMFMYKFILNMAAAERSEILTVKMQFNPKRDNLSLEWFQTTMFMLRYTAEKAKKGTYASK